MEFFLTGGTGFIGSHLLQNALNKNHKVNALRRGKSSIPKIKLNKEPYWINKNFEDVDSSDFKNSEALIHLASHSANVPYDNLENCLKFNVFQTLTLFNKAYDCGIRKYLITGSSFEYGKEAENFEFIPPNAPLFPTQSYPASKAAASLILTQWAMEKKVSLKILRLFQVFGEGEKENRFWPSINKTAKSGKNFKMTYGDQIRDFIKVEDVSEKIINESLSFTKNRVTIKNIGSGRPTKLKIFAKKIWEELEAKGIIEYGAIPYRENEVMRYVPDTISEYIIK